MADNLTDRTAGQAAAHATIAALLTHGRLLLARRSDCATLDAQLLLAHVLGRPRSELLTHPERAVAPACASAYHALLARAAAGEPLAYLTGMREFWSLPLTVTPAVLIPRPETELAVERCLALLRAGPYRLCDLGTGSGAIALALSREQPSWLITATDQSAAALAVARSNAERLAVRGLEFLQGDWFAPLPGRRFDLIVSNPPYVAADDPAMAALAHEPRQALSPGPSGLEALEMLVEHSPAHLAHGGWLVLEHGADQAAAVARALVARGYARVRCHQDLAERDRVTEALWP
ncbi:MAG TPA: peptide chain release factor N(5)-glutamine methyltransferase [Steroidobacteraceae bacterium]|jgi:release factor glutamine methyltransferase|nr:peptide chain release factor N(5)-glutamine methyltransferase [Steroidobacteraceae bacterium]